MQPPLFLLLLLLQLMAHTPRVWAQSMLDIFRNRNSASVNIVDEPASDNYDFVVVGGGSGGCAVAYRLAENPTWRVLLLEAGAPESVFDQVPALVNLFQPDESNSWSYVTEPQPGACLGMRDRRCRWPTGKSLGGSSSIGYMIYGRGNKLDYNNWENLGNVGWSYKDVLPYFKRSEVFNTPEMVNMSYHGSKGHVHVEYMSRHTNLSTSFLRVGKDLGFPIVDYNAKDQIGFSFLQVNMDNGRRCSAATAYLSKRRSNLHVLIGARVTKILIKNRQAYGVKYIHNGKKQTIRASKEVILSAGTINSAHLLMLSGIGPKEQLERLGIRLVHDAHVGHNLREHVGFFGLNFLVNQSVSLLPGRMSGPSRVLNYLFRGDGLMSVPGGLEALAFARSHRAKDQRPDVELLFVSGPLHADRSVHLKSSLGLNDNMYQALFRPIEGRDAWSIWPIVQTPRSVGQVSLRSKNPFDPPVIQPNLLDDPLDIELILEGLKYAIEISETDEFLAYGSRLYRAKVPGCDDLLFGEDDYWRCAIRHLTLSMNHPVGTVKMGPANDPSAVVDPQLRVYGVRGLRVVDASIMPTLPTGHPNGVVYMIAEKAADMIKRTWLNGDDEDEDDDDDNQDA